MSSKFIYLSTPVGEIAINTAEIVAVGEAGARFDPTVAITYVYITNIKQPFNILEGFAHVMARIEEAEK